MNILMML